TMRADAAKPCSAPWSPAWLGDEPTTTPEPNKSLLLFSVAFAPGLATGFCDEQPLVSVQFPWMVYKRSFLLGCKSLATFP
ncbi:MAG: hypothetical protein ACRYG8_35805, partial [Janthinobacterium lividum]